MQTMFVPSWLQSMLLRRLLSEGPKAVRREELLSINGTNSAARQTVLAELYHLQQHRLVFWVKRGGAFHVGLTRDGRSLAAAIR